MFLILLIAGLAIVTRSESKAMEPPPRLEIGPDGALRLANGPGQQISRTANTSSRSATALGNPHPQPWQAWRYQPGGRAYSATGTRGGSCPGAPTGACHR